GWWTEVPPWAASDPTKPHPFPVAASHVPAASLGASFSAPAARPTCIATCWGAAIARHCHDSDNSCHSRTGVTSHQRRSICAIEHRRAAQVTSLMDEWDNACIMDWSRHSLHFPGKVVSRAGLEPAHWLTERLSRLRRLMARAIW